MGKRVVGSRTEKRMDIFSGKKRRKKSKSGSKKAKKKTKKKTKRKK